MQLPAFLLVFFLGVIPGLTASAAVEIHSPAPASVLRSGKLVVIGTADEEGRGLIEWPGGSTAFRVRRGGFHSRLELPDGENQIRVTVGDQSVVATWRVDPGAFLGTYEYHPKVLDNQCEACHPAQEPPPVGIDVSATCNACHTPYLGRRHTHGPVAMGLCTACHDPHGSLEPSQLRFPPEELCTYCHNQPVTEDHRSRAGDDPCLRCHDPHGSNREYQLKHR